MTFGLITEGVTDQLVISTIIDTIINDEEDRADTRELCPMPAEQGTWSKVFSYIQSDTFQKFFQIRDDNYAIIQIDTDMINDWVAFFKGNQPVLDHLKTIPALSKEVAGEIVEKVSQLFRMLMGAEFYDQYKDRIICAVSVNEMECWVLAMHATTPSDKSKVVGCLGALNQILKSDGYGIAKKGKAAGGFQYYRKAIKDMTKKKSLLDKYHHNESLKIFVDRIQQFC
ncbi:MAG: hypothetical protein JSS76_13740 [Bacteroidetes bacterium]|nr:hypothetical protein [Bacteroidota bacterium]